MALAPANIVCWQSRSNKRFPLLAYSHRGRKFSCSPSPTCDQDPCAAVGGINTSSASRDLVPRDHSSRRRVYRYDSCHSVLRSATLPGRFSVSRLKSGFKLEGFFWKRRHSGVTAWSSRSLSLLGKRKRGMLCGSLVIQITLFLLAVGCGSPHLFLTAAAVARPSSLPPLTTLHGGELNNPSAFLATKARRKQNENVKSPVSLEVKEEAQSETAASRDILSSVTARITNGAPAVSVSSPNTTADGAVSRLADARSGTFSAATATPRLPQSPTTSQLHNGGSFLAAEASSPPSARVTLPSGDLSGPAAAASRITVSPRASLVSSTTRMITTNSVAAATSKETLFDAAGGDRSGVSSTVGTAELLSDSGPLSRVTENRISLVDSPSKAAVNSSEETVFRQSPIRERLVRPYSPGPTARAMSFAASSGIPLCHECNSFSNSSPAGGCSRVCLHGEKTPNFMMPIRAVRTIDTHPQEVVQLLEANHHAHLNLNKNFYVLRGKGPFGSLGNSIDSLPRKDDATAAARLGLHFPELPHISFAQLQGTGQTAATNAAAGTHTTATSSIINNGVAEDGEKHEKGMPGRVTEHLQLTLAEASVPIMQMKDSQYVGLLGIGTPLQYVEPVFDTGSTNLWVVGSDCKDDTCEKVTRFDPSASSTFRPSNPPVNLDITFGTGRINGCTAVDNFSIGPFLVKDQTFGLVQKESGHNMHGNIFKAINFEGIVGLAFPEMSSTGALPLYDHLVQDGNLKANEFAFYMAKNFPVSGLFFGGVDPRFFEPPIHMFPVSKEHYWETPLDAIYIGDEKFCCDEPSFVILDSGTSFNTLPGKDMRRLMEKIPPRECDLEDPEFTQTYKPITYIIGGVKFPLKPEEYLVRNDKNECKPAFMQIEVPAEYGPAYILGSVSFMRHYYTVYRRSDGRRPSLVGIARAVHTDENKSYLADVLREFPGVQELEKKGVLSLDKSLDFFSDKEL